MGDINGLHIKGFLETSFLDWPGQVASVLFLGGCNFRCPFCHNYGLVLCPEEFPDLDWTDVKQRLKRLAGWVDGVVVSGGEPTLNPDLSELCRQIAGMGFLVKLDTNGSRPDVLETLLEEGLLAHVAMDVKAPLDDVSYGRASGRPGFAGRVRESLHLLEKGETPYTVRTTLVPQIHTEDDVFRMAEQLKSAPEWVLQNFVPDNALDSSLRKSAAWERETFAALVDRALKFRAGAS